MYVYIYRTDSLGRKLRQLLHREKPSSNYNYVGFQKAKQLLQVNEEMTYLNILQMRIDMKARNAPSNQKSLMK